MRSSTKIFLCALPLGFFFFLIFLLFGYFYPFDLFFCRAPFFIFSPPRPIVYLYPADDQETDQKFGIRPFVQHDSSGTDKLVQCWRREGASRDTFPMEILFLRDDAARGAHRPS